MSKTHLKIAGVDYRNSTQSEHDYSHQTACGYVREDVTTNDNKVDCFYCLRSEDMKRYQSR